MARAARAAGASLRVARAVFDPQPEALPDLSGWIDARGRGRPLRIALGLLRAPWLLPRLPGFRRRIGACSQALATWVGLWLDELDSL